MLLAPKAGSELRGVIGEQGRNLGGVASEQYKKGAENATGWADRGREFVDKAREAVNRGAEEAREYASGATGSNGTTRPTGRPSARPPGTTGSPGDARRRS